MKLNEKEKINELIGKYCTATFKTIHINEYEKNWKKTSELGIFITLEY